MKYSVATFFLSLLLAIISCTKRLASNNNELWSQKYCRLERLEFQEVTDTLRLVKDGEISGGVVANGKVILSEKINLENVGLMLKSGDKTFIDRTTLKVVKVGQEFYEKYANNRKALCDILEGINNGVISSKDGRQRAENLYIDIVQLFSGIRNPASKQTINDALSGSLNPINKSEMLFEYSVNIRSDLSIFSNYNQKMKRVFHLYSGNQDELPKGTFRFNNTNMDTNEIRLVALILSPDSPYYPDKDLDKDVYSILCNASLDISICTKNLLLNGTCSASKANLSFSTAVERPTITYWFSEPLIEMDAKGLKPNKQDLAWRNNGGLETLNDLADGVIQFSLNEQVVENWTDDQLKLLSSYKIKGFGINLSDRIFSSFDLCRLPFKDYTEYYITLPNNILKTHLNLECKQN